MERCEICHRDYDENKFECPNCKADLDKEFQKLEALNVKPKKVEGKGK